MEPEVYLSKITAEFPQIGWRSYRFLTHGWDHVVVILDEKIVFRFPREGSYQQALVNEINLLAYLKKKIRQWHLTVAIPDYIYPCYKPHICRLSFSTRQRARTRSISYAFNG